MSLNAWLVPLAFIALLLVLVRPLGSYMARVFGGEITWLASLERGIYRLGGVDSDKEMDWKNYALAVLIFNFLGFVLLYLLQRGQVFLPLNPADLPAVRPDTAFNTAVSFVTNTNWQSYSGESTLSYLTQMLGLGVQNFLSAATGIGVLLALTRGIARQKTQNLGNFWVDIVRSLLYVLLPLALVLALLLVSQGVVQSFSSYVEYAPLEASSQSAEIPLGPAASQIAIKELGTNGGGFFGVNSSHPFENPTPLSNLLEMLAILLIPAALTRTFGLMVGQPRQGWALLGAMLILFVPAMYFGVYWEQTPNLAWSDLAVTETGNLEGKEVRFGPVESALWAAATTAASNGSVNSMHDSFTALGGLVPLFLMMLGEVVFGGVGSGLYGMLAFAVVAVFIAGLMVGRSPEYLGKKIGPYEMKMAAIVVIITPMLVLLTTALALVVPAGVAAILNPGSHGFSEVLYAFTSMANNNGSAFAGLGVNIPLYNSVGGVAMALGRYFIIIPVLALAGSLAAGKVVPPGLGTLPTHTPLFAFWLAAVVILVGALNFFPALALGPLAEYFEGIYGR